MNDIKVPLRKCVVTNGRFPKKELIRIVKNKENIVSVDETGKASGKGAYIQRKIEVLDKAKKSKVLDRALGIKIEETIYEELLTIIK